jgi:23S rRNA pseudouridine2605 synthase
MAEQRSTPRRVTSENALYSRIKPEQRRKNNKTFRRRPKKEGAAVKKVHEDDGKVRLNKYLADAGVASRRKADEIIEAGSITINGRKVFELGIRVDPKHDKILLNGKPIKATTNFVYFVFNKPKSVVTSTIDPQGRRTVIDYFGKTKHRLFPVGRLDWDTEGLLLVTNDGEFAQKVIHPEADVSKTYHVKLDGIPNDVQLEKLRKGVSIIGGRVAALRVKRLTKSTDKKGWVEIAIAEGKNHQIKLMFQKIGFDVIKLRRVAIGELWINPSLKPGDFRELTYADLKRIFKKPTKAALDKKDAAMASRPSKEKIEDQDDDQENDSGDDDFYGD